MKIHEQFIEDTKDKFDKDYSLLKLAEECSELSVVINQLFTKGIDPELYNEFLAEMADVEMMLARVKQKLQISDLLLDAVKEVKCEKVQRYLDTIPNFGRIQR
jgi:hypothetical protein